MKTLKQLADAVEDTALRALPVVRALNRTYGLAPARPAGDPERAVAFDGWNGTVKTADGNRYTNGDYLVVSGDVHALPDLRLEYATFAVGDHVTPTVGMYRGSPARVIDLLPSGHGCTSLIEFGTTYRVRYDVSELKAVSSE